MTGNLIPVQCRDIADIIVLVNNILSLSQVKALISALEAIRDKDPSIKSLVISQFTSYLDIVSDQLERHGFVSLRLDGSMTVEERTKVLEEFSDDCPATVFLLSMSAGGTGLSLTAASRVFLLDPVSELLDTTTVVLLILHTQP